MTVESLTAVQLASTQVRICALVVDDPAVLAEPLPVAPVPVEPLPVDQVPVAPNPPPRVDPAPPASPETST